jgi:hypothetical protein
LPRSMNVDDPYQISRSLSTHLQRSNQAAVFGPGSS